MQPGQPPPAWAMSVPPPPLEGTHPPASGLSIQGGLTPPDAAGHQWVLLTIGDGTVTTTLRIPWQVAAGFGATIAAGMQNLVQEAQAKAGPSLIVPPPSGTGLNLDHLRNGRKP
jgi:hypothetical protein